MKQNKWLGIMIAGLFAFAIVFLAGSMLFAKNTADAGKETDVLLCKEETKWYYKTENGAIQKRLWSLTYGKWLGDWQIVSVIPTEVPEEPKGFLSKTKAEINSLVYEYLKLNKFEWRVGLLKQTEDEVYCIVYPMAAQTEITGCCATITEKRQDWMYAVYLRYEGSEIIKSSVSEFGISQLGFFETENGLLLGFVYRDVVAGWEEYGMACYLMDEYGSFRRMNSMDERSYGLYRYWKNRKPVLKEDGTIEIFTRKQEEDFFDRLVLNEELKSFELYTEYVPEYVWEKEKQITATEWVEKKVWTESYGNDASGPELVRALKIAENNNMLPEEIYFYVGGENAVVTEYLNKTYTDEVYYIIKKYGDSHQAGFQSLYIVVMDLYGEILQCKRIGGDRAQALLTETEEGVQIVYRAETEYTGIKTGRSGIIYLTPDTWEECGMRPNEEETEEFLPIDEAHFGSGLFCDFIKEKFDKDSDGCLSVLERYAVTRIEFPAYYEEDYNEECLNGFEYFPELTDISVDQNAFERVVLNHHPSLKSFGGTEGFIKDLEIKDCPELTDIGFYTYGIGSLLISGVSSEASFSHGDNVRIDNMTVDADLTLGVTDSRDGEPSFKVSGDELVYEYFEYGENNNYTMVHTPVEFINRKEQQVPFSESEWLETLEQGEFDLFEIQVLEKTEEDYNEEGKCGWNICVNYTKSKNSREVYSGKESFTLYSDEMPTAQQFVFQPAEIRQIRVLEYAPNREARMLTEWDVNLVYRTEKEEQIIGILTEHEHYCTIGADGTIEAILSRERWNE